MKVSPDYTLSPLSPPCCILSEGHMTSTRILLVSIGRESIERLKVSKDERGIYFPAERPENRTVVILRDLPSFLGGLFLGRLWSGKRFLCRDTERSLISDGSRTPGTACPSPS